MNKPSVNHLAENDLILYFYGEAPKTDVVAQHLVDCPGCRDEYARLRATLSAIDLPIPERAPDYEAQLWSTLNPRLVEAGAEKKNRSFWSAALQPRRWAIAGALATIVVAAFLAGRFTRPQPPAPGPSPVTQASTQQPLAHDRILMVAVGDHLDRTQMVLVELANTRAEGKVDISTERDLAQNLVDENRLYRLTAQHKDDPEIASVLDQVERVLIDIAHQPDSVSAKQLEELQQRIEAQGVLFKIRVIDSKVKAGNRANQQPAARNSSL